MRVSVLKMLVGVLAVGAVLTASPAEARPLRPKLVLREDGSFAPRVTHHESNTTSSMLGETAVTCSVNSLSGTCITVDECQKDADQTSVPGHCAGADDIQCCVKQAEPAPGCGTAALKRAETWIRTDLQYCQSPNGAVDGDSACSHICERARNREWDPYRSDCSAFVSYAYGVRAPGRVTSEFAPYTTDISFKLASAADLAPGDAINSTPDEHIMLFHSWLNSDKTRARLYEEPGCSASPPHARVTDSDVTHLSDGNLHVAANGMTFFPIRMFSNKDKC